MAQYPDAEVEVWAEDEHRIGLHPVNRQVWVPQGEQPIAVVNWKYKWLWLVGWVCPTLGETDWWIVPRLNRQVFSPVLADFAQHFEVGAHQRVILAVDQASFHTSEEVQVPEGIHRCFCPRNLQNSSPPSNCDR